MQKCKLGFSDLNLSEIGFGCWALGGGDWSFGWGEQDDQEAIQAIHKGIDLGINWIDTAAVYGLGHAEEIDGRAVEGIRNELIIATKCSLVWNDSKEISANLNADSVMRECEQSLQRLNTDIIDLYQIHWPNDEEHIEEGWEAVNRLIEQGKVRYGGVSNFNVSHLERSQKVAPIASLQPPYSMLRRSVELKGEFDYCQKNDIGIVAYSPMQSGLLTGKFDMSRVAENDWRRNAKEYQEPNLSINLEFADHLRPIAEKYGKSVAQLVIAWVLRLDIVTSAIVGARRPSQIEETVGGAGWKIGDADIQEIESFLNHRAEKIKKAEGYSVD